MSCNNYNTHADHEKGNVEISFYLTPNGTNLLLKPLVSLIIVDSNKLFLSQVGENRSKYTDMDIMDKVKLTANTSIEGFEEAASVGTIPTAVTYDMEKLTGLDPGSPEKRLKTFLPPGIETISDPVMEKYISKIQVHMNHSTEVIVRVQAIISLLNSKI